MNLKTFVTYSFDHNVGTFDRALRILSGLALAAIPLVLTLPSWGTAALIIAGAAWMLTGVLSRCGMYYLMGYSTCPVKRK